MKDFLAHIAVGLWAAFMALATIAAILSGLAIVAFIILEGFSLLTGGG